MTCSATCPRPLTLLTGATGLIGRYLLADLSRSRLPIAVLVRSNRYQSAAERVEAVLADIERRSERTFVRPVVIEGDLNHPQLGLSRDQCEWVTRNCGRVLHAAASLSFKPAAEHPDGEPVRTNVKGTARLLEFCQKVGIREWHYVSTAYVCGLRSGRVREDERSQGQCFANDYEQSKVTAENALHAAPGIDTLTVYRPSIVIDPISGSDMSDKSLHNTFATYQMLSRQFGLPEPGEWLGTLGLSGDERKNIVKADWVARMIVQILRHPDLYDRTYHLTAKSGISVAEMERGFRFVAEESGVGSRTTSTSPSPEALTRLAAPFVETFAHYFRDDPQFDRTNIEHAMAACNESPCPEASIEDIHNLSRDQIKVRATIPFNGAAGTAPRVFPMHMVANWSAANPDQAIGLFASGPGGGEWAIGMQEGSIDSVHIGGADLCSVRLYAQVDTWNQLLDSVLTTQMALDEGQLLIESHETACHSDVAAKLIAILPVFLARMRRSLPADDRDEVVHVR